MDDRLAFIAALIDSKNQNQAFGKFKEILYGDFLEFSNNDKYLANETKIFLQLQEIEKELSIISSYPKLHEKTKIAIGGGFSSGKSEFISSFLNGIKLPTGITPTTAIPSYVIDEDENRVLAISFKGGVVEVDKKFHSKLSHDFISSFGFNLKEVLPFMVVGSKMLYKNICFVDTPGYDPSGSGYSSEDIKISKEFLDSADCFIWLIGVDVNGTIPHSDLKFLKELNKKEIFIVLNKADLKSNDEVEDILDEVVEVLEDSEVEIAGICAYSSCLKQELLYDKLSLFQFLDSKNIPSQKHAIITKKLQDIYKTYKYAILKKEKETQAIYDYIHSIALDMLENDASDSGFFDKLEKLKYHFYFTKTKTILKELDKVFSKIQEQIDAIFKIDSGFLFEALEIGEIVIDFEYSKNEEIQNEIQEDSIIDDLMDDLKDL